MIRPTLTVAVLAASIRIALAQDVAVLPATLAQAKAVTAMTQTAEASPVWLVGQVTAADGSPLPFTEVLVEGTDHFAFTGEDGRYTIELPPGDYTLLVRADGLAEQRFADVAVAAGEVTTRDIVLADAAAALAGAAGEAAEEQHLDTIEVEEQVVRDGSSTAVALDRRYSAQVVDSISAEQISRAGDSDAAAALKRVTGLTLVDGKFIYVRGLGERYSAVTLNGAQVPSPDPTRRVVPIDLFPTDVLDSVEVQKTYSAHMPGEFGGGTVQLRTRSYPDSFRLRASTSLGYAEGTTGHDGLGYRGGDRDWSGRDDGSRDMPAALLGGRLSELSPAERERAAEALAAQGYTPRDRNLGPNGTLAFGIGDSFGDDIRFGYSAALRHAQSWDNREETLRKYPVIDGVVSPTPTEAFERERTERAIDSSALVTAGVAFGGNHKIDSAFMLLRQTTDDVRIDEGYDTEPSDLIQNHQLEWLENELLVKQFSGQHEFPSLSYFSANWAYTRSDASRIEPNTREYRNAWRADTSSWRLVRGSQGNRQRSARLDDSAEELAVDLSLPLQLTDDLALTIDAGAGRLERDRDSWIRRYLFRTGASPLIAGIDHIEDLLTPEFIGTDPALVVLEDAFQPTDVYAAGQELDSRYLSLDIAFADRYRLNVGVRREDNRQEVTTFQPFAPNTPPEVALIDRADTLPAGTFTWMYSDKAQLRVGYSETLSRPDFRELTRSPYTDPVTDATMQGNPNLQPAYLKNYDLRWEYYFSEGEALSVAGFLKEFENPIEIVRVPGTGDLREPRNAREATNYGIELDYVRSLGGLRRWPVFESGWLGGLPWDDLFLALNYTWIDSEIELGEDVLGNQTTDNRPLQGQSRYVTNVQLGWRKPDGRAEATLLYNVFGERIAGVGTRGLPDIYEQPLHQLDFVWRQRLGEHWRWSLRLRNLLDEPVEYTQGGLPYRVYDKGRDVTLSLEWSW